MTITVLINATRNEIHNGVKSAIQSPIVQNDNLLKLL